MNGNLAGFSKKKKNSPAQEFNISTPVILVTILPLSLYVTILSHCICKLLKRTLEIRTKGAFLVHSATLLSQKIDEFGARPSS